MPAVFYANHNNTLLVSTLNNNQGSLSASGDLAITAADITTTDGTISAHNMRIAADYLNSTNSNMLAANHLDLTIAQQLNNRGIIQANQNLTLQTKNLNNAHLVIAHNASLNATTLHNQTAGILHAKKWSQPEYRQLRQ